MDNDHNWTGPCPDPDCPLCNRDGNILAPDGFLSLLTEEDRAFLRMTRIDYTAEAL